MEFYLPTLRLARRFGGLKALYGLNEMLRRLTSATHKLQLDMQWRVRPPPEWFDTFIGQYYTWRNERPSWIWDRGVFSTLAMKPGCRVLDICCGGGFFTYHFYSGRAAEVVAVDFDPAAINHARRYNSAPNIRYEVCDIRHDLPAGPFDVVVWDGAVEHFTEEEIDGVCRKIKERMAPGATLTCYTVRRKDDGTLMHPDHEYEFSSTRDIVRVFRPYFRNVLAFESLYEARNNLHMLASDGPLPFDPEWPRGYRIDDRGPVSPPS